MPFTRFVEVGRVVFINYGPDYGKLATIVDIVDGKRVLIDGPQEITGVHRQVISTKRVFLTSIVATGLQRGATQKSLKAAWKDQNVLAKWNETAWAKKVEARKRRAALSDFDRFKVMVAKKQRSKLIAEKLSA